MMAKLIAEAITKSKPGKGSFVFVTGMDENAENQEWRVMFKGMLQKQKFAEKGPAEAFLTELQTRKGAR